MKRTETYTPVLFYRIRFKQGGGQTTYLRIANHRAPGSLQTLSLRGHRHVAGTEKIRGYEFCVGECDPDEPTFSFALLLIHRCEISDEDYAVIVLAGQEESKKFSLSYFSEKLAPYPARRARSFPPGKFYLAGMVAPLLLVVYRFIPRLRTQFKIRYNPNLN
jgi:hypothetical protein